MMPQPMIAPQAPGGSDGYVTALFICQGHRQPMRRVTQAQAIFDLGFHGDAHAKPRSRRQILLVSGEELETFQLKPGDLRENVTVDGFGLANLAAGQRLRLGQAVLEVTGPCDPCQRMDEIRPGLQEALRGRRGIVARVIASGIVRVGEAIVPIPHDEPSPSPLAYEPSGYEAPI